MIQKREREAAIKVSAPFIAFCPTREERKTHYETKFASSERASTFRLIFPLILNSQTIILKFLLRQNVQKKAEILIFAIKIIEFKIFLDDCATKNGEQRNVFLGFKLV